jgi:hypothetical protein
VGGTGVDTLAQLVETHGGIPVAGESSVLHATLARVLTQRTR